MPDAIRQVDSSYDDNGVRGNGSFYHHEPITVMSYESQNLQQLNCVFNRLWKRSELLPICK